HQITSIPTRDTGSEGPCEISGLVSVCEINCINIHCIGIIDRFFNFIMVSKLLRMVRFFSRWHAAACHAPRLGLAMFFQRHADPSHRSQPNVWNGAHPLRKRSAPDVGNDILYRYERRKKTVLSRSPVAQSAGPPTA
ncbi:hypothetical protein, partial [Gluconacetobacter sacchari]|uniref:hypothetical protein n=1 Tax=Gluconacetobacter sacchari TaxID=92759 RepID=UPI00222E0FAB